VLTANGRADAPALASLIPRQAISKQEAGLLLTYVPLRPKRPN